MNASDFQIGQRVMVTGPRYNGTIGTVARVGNGTVFVLSETFGKGWKNSREPRGFHPDHLASVTHDSRNQAS